MLQWGTGYFGGNYWTMASWYNIGNNYYHSTWQRVTGSTVSGDISGNGCNTKTGVCTTWTMTTYDWGSRVSTAITRASWTVAMYSVQGGALEVYGASTCAMLPGTSVTFSNFYVKTVSNVRKYPTWSAAYWPTTPSCGYSVSMGSSQSIKLKY